jgi:hypothetical protein
MSKRKPKYCITRTSVAVVLTLIVIVFSCEEKMMVWLPMKVAD